MKLLPAILCLAAGAYLMCWVQRRRFNRTNKYGHEEFRSYSGKAVARSLEKIVWVAAVILIVIGVTLALSI